MRLMANVLAGGGILILGLWLGGLGGGGQKDHADAPAANAPTGKAVTYTCSMHPQVRQPGPGKCPICAMDLIPVAAQGSGDADGDSPKLVLTGVAEKLAQVATSPVERKFVDLTVRMVGMLSPDETRVGSITAWVPGRIDRLFVNFTGIAVRQGDHMAEVYSPQLVTVQAELIMASKQKQSDVLGGLRESARERLRLWGLTKDQIDAIEKRDRASDNLTILAPISGIVLSKNVVEGQYVDTGAVLFRIADLSKLWLYLDAYESDLQWLRYGQRIDFEVPAWPGETFHGTISFIDPTLDMRTRTSKVRVVVDNAAGRLKPGMFARAGVRAEVTEDGSVRNPSLEGKWICPMHPEVVKDQAGKCDVCGMPLVRSEDLGYRTTESGSRPPLVIPASAPLITGRRAVVYVAVAGEERAYEGREVTLGPRAGDYYVVDAGLREGEQVVTHGNFKIDSALQILAKPSMMSAPGGGKMPAASPTAAPSQEPDGPAFNEVSDEIRRAVDDLLNPCLALAEALASDDLTSAAAAAEKLAAAADGAPHGPLGDEAHVFWMKERTAIAGSARALAAQKENIGQARVHFKTISDAAIRIVRRLGTSGARPVMVLFCPMAFDNRGAEWLQDNENVRNPYFGAQMLQCGELRQTIGKDKGK